MMSKKNCTSIRRHLFYLPCLSISHSNLIFNLSREILLKMREHRIGKERRCHAIKSCELAKFRFALANDKKLEE